MYMDENKKYIGKKEKFSYGIAAVGSYMIANVIASYLQIFLTDILIVSPVFILVLMVAARFWDMANDPIMGIVIDKTNTPRGKMRPYIKVGAFLIFGVSLLIFLPISSAPSWLKMIFAAVMYLAFDTAYTVVDVPAMGLMSVATPNGKERASLLSFYVTIGSIGTVLPIGLMAVLGSFIPERWVYFAIAAITGVVIFTGYSLLYRNSKERFAMHSEKVKVKDMFKTAIKNKPMLLTLLTSMIAAPRYLIMLAAAYMLQQGTPFIYQGQEIGMTNLRLPRLDMYVDVMLKNNCRIASKLLPQSVILKLAQNSCRDSARTPMQWTGGPWAGFSETRPWFYVNENYRDVNVEVEEKDEDSLLNFYRELIAFRKAEPLVQDGVYKEHLRQSPNFYVYSREADGRRLLVICSFADKETYFTCPEGFDLAKGRLVLKNHELNVVVNNQFTARPYELRVYLFE